MKKNNNMYSVCLLKLSLFLLFSWTPVSHNIRSDAFLGGVSAQQTCSIYAYMTRRFCLEK